MATTQFFTRSVFVNVAKCESNWAQAEEEVYSEQSEVIQEFPVFSDNLVSVDAFTEIWPHLFFQMSNPKKGEKFLKQRKFKIYWSRWIKIRGLTAYFIPLSLLWLLSEFCSAVIPATFISSLRHKEFCVASSEPLWKYLFYHQLWDLALSRSLLVLGAS